MRFLVLAIALLLLAPAGAMAKTYKVPEELGSSLISVQHKTDVDIALPDSLPLDYSKKLYASGSGHSKSYELSLAGARNCGNATACFIASFTGQKGGRLSFKTRVKLDEGITGRFKPLSCGGSCSPPIIEWKEGGNLYSIQAKVDSSTTKGDKATLVKAANEAIGGGPRFG